MFDVISIGNATMDVFVWVRSKKFIKGSQFCLDLGHKIETDGMDYFSGGGATNTAVSFSRLGLKTGILASVGLDESGEKILNELNNEKIDTSMLITSKKYKTAYSVVLTGFSRDRIILTYRGATGSLPEEKAIKWKKLKSKWFYISSLHSNGLLLNRFVNLASKNGTKVAFNPGKFELKKGLKKLSSVLKKVSLLFLNETEAKLLTRSGNVKQNLKKLQKFSPIVVITRGKKGPVIFDGKKFYSRTPPFIKVRDATGAGDSFGSSFTAGIIKGLNIEEAMNLAVVNANSVISNLGAKNKLLSWMEAKKLT